MSGVGVIKRLLRVATVSVAISVAACGGGDDADETAAPTTPSTGASSVTTPAAESAADPFCASVDVLSGDLGVVGPEDGDPDRLREQFAQAGEAIALAEADAPEELGAAVATLADGYRDFLAELEAVDFDFTQLSGSASAALDSPDLRAAGEQVEAYRVAACGEG